MSGPQISMTNFSPDPRIRGLLGGPVSYNDIRTFLPDNPQVVKAPFGYKSNPWTVMGGQSPQNISGAMDEEANTNGIERGAVVNYVARAFSNKTDLDIITGDLVFGLRSQTQSTGVTTISNLPCLNAMLRQGYEENKVRFKDFKETFPEFKNVEYLSEEDLFGERWYDKWVDEWDDCSLSRAKKKKKNVADQRRDDEVEENDGPRAIRIVSKRSNEYKRELEEVMDMPIEGVNRGMNKAPAFSKLIEANLTVMLSETNKQYKAYCVSRKFWMEKKDLMVGGLRFMYTGIIMDHWNWLGVVRSSTNDSEYVNVQTYGTGGKSTVLAVTVEKKSNSFYNVFHNTLEIGDKLFLILKREGGAAGWGAPQYFPWSKGKERPSYDDIKYVDESGRMAKGHVIFLGTLSESLNGVVRPQSKRISASGLNRGTSIKEAHTDRVGLDLLTVHLRIGQVIG